MAGLLAVILPEIAWQVLGVVAAGVTLLGVWFAWQRQWHRSDIEERLKERKISDAEAHRQIRFIEVRAIALICGGVVVLIVALANSL